VENLLLIYYYCFTFASIIWPDISLKLKAMQDSVDRATEADVRLMKNVAVTHRIGFADVIGWFLSLFCFWFMLNFLAFT